MNERTLSTPLSEGITCFGAFDNLPFVELIVRNPEALMLVDGVEDLIATIL